MSLYIQNLFDFLKKRFQLKFYTRIFSYFWKERFYIATLILLIFCSVGVGWLSIYPLGIAIDLLGHEPMKKDDPIYQAFFHILPTHPLYRLLGLAAWGLLLRLLDQAIWVSRVMINNRIKYKGVSRVRNQLHHHLLALGSDFYRNRSQGDLLYRSQTDVWGFFEVLNVFIGSLAAVVSFLWFGIYLVVKHRLLGATAFAVFPFMLITYRFFGSRIRERAQISKQQDARFLTFLQRILGSVRLIQVFHRKEQEATSLWKENRATMKAHMSLDWQETLYPSAIDLIFATSTALIFGYGAVQVYQGSISPNYHSAFTLGKLTIFLGLLPKFFDPMTWILGFPTKVKTNAVSCERIFSILDTPIHPPEPKDALQLAIKPRTVSFDNVHFAYDPETPLLQDISLQILPHQMVAFMGPSGTGKTTLLNLLLRFEEPLKGILKLDGINSHSIALSVWRKHFAFVPQDAGLFPGTIRENIAYGIQEPTEEEIQEAAKLSGAHTFIESFPQKYDTVILEGSQNLSGGQRQRIAFARALLTRAPILVLDEPTSALDPEQRKKILKTLLQLKKKRTIIMITHETTDTIECDKVYILSQGSVSEQSAHLRLIPPTAV